MIFADHGRSSIQTKHTLIQLLHSSSFSSKKVAVIQYCRFLLQLYQPVFLCRIGSFLVCYCFQYIECSQAIGIFLKYPSTHLIAMEKHYFSLSCLLAMTVSHPTCHQFACLYYYLTVDLLLLL